MIVSEQMAAGCAVALMCGSSIFASCELTSPCVQAASNLPTAKSFTNVAREIFFLTFVVSDELPHVQHTARPHCIVSREIPPPPQHAR